MPAKLTADRWRQLEAINHEINSNTRYKTDIDLYGSPEFWEVANGQGDCEDYALAKRKALLGAGWDPSEVRLALVRTERGDPHAVLTVDTDLGTYVLDNRRRMVEPYRALGYQWDRRQAKEGSGWVEVAPDAQ
jgi:predicted transglutaminase-like cysteine proteinase